ncbi:MULTISPECIES: restriction endonuclease subunit S [unclassified Microcystis]|jgi:type I restriction enzyme S subunit|uniref:Restriction endonuclease subunit S n=3 Tax=Microcystis TaxID=1125 RepID=A0A552AYP5_MICAE|nr:MULTISPECIES: restriction endonuclease subunit S [unclassified Microcystis]MCA2815528.1 restriction endonuclease subunit S [Microcystis sp. M085S1]MCA2854147.1 restriction endonuclease subunit S [Microcystis sp. M065S1]TRT80581.1 MAG: restriction endonuclease subunit S [Microcystis flos-aquae Ma_QC_C_20070823_S18]TRT90545.1 MAG: restriction endonuclease subunit S [Microcystis aeruginosa Ma_OC_H_19870700_S124]TRU01888.1 MAG: restriction endonuclease subunit S [Microcystis flos-aquae Ma_QC_C_
MRTTTFRDVLLEEIAEIKSGVGFPISMQGCESGDFPFAKVGDISNRARSGEQFISDAPNWVKNEDLSTLKFTPFPTGTIVFAKIGEAIRQNFRAVSTRPMLFDNNVMGVIPQEERVDTTYLYFYLRTLDFYHLAGKTTVPAIRKSTIEKLKIPLPPLEEQRKIAAILDKADGVRRKRKEAIRLTEELLRSTFLEMFGDPVTNPKGWRKISLGELLAEPLQNGAYFPKERYVEAPDGVEMVHMSDAFYNFVERGQLKRVQVTSEEFEKYKLIPNDVLIARRSLNYEGSAKPCLISEADQPLIFESSLIRVRLNAEVIDSFFFFSYMLEPRARSAYVFPNVTKSTISGINQAGLRRISVLVPPMSNQKKYRDIYKKILGTQSNYQKDYENIDNLFNSLLQRAFRGEL